jgi:hypothetical protein
VIVQLCHESVLSLGDQELSRSRERGYVVSQIVGTPHGYRYRADGSTWESRCVVARYRRPSNLVRVTVGQSGDNETGPERIDLFMPRTFSRLMHRTFA